MGKSGFAQARLVGKAFVGEGGQHGGAGKAVSDDMARHGSAKALGPYCLHLEAAGFLYVEDGLNDGEFALHALPVEEVVVLLGGKMEQAAIVGLDGVYQEICEALFPEGGNAFLTGNLQLYGVLHAIGHYAIEGAQHAIEERGDPKMGMGVVKVGCREGFGLEVLVSLSEIGKEGGPGLRAEEMLKALPIFGGELTAAIKLEGEGVDIERCHLGGEKIGLALETGLRQPRHAEGRAHYFGIGKEYLHWEVGRLRRWRSRGTARVRLRFLGGKALLRAGSSRSVGWPAPAALCCSSLWLSLLSLAWLYIRGFARREFLSLFPWG